MALSGAVTLLALPTVLKLAEKVLFRIRKGPVAASCNCGFCIIISVAAAIMVEMNLHEYWKLGWSRRVLISIIVIPVMVLVCGIMSRRQACKRDAERQNVESEV
jgi:hypothetical protein